MLQLNVQGYLARDFCIPLFNYPSFPFPSKGLPITYSCWPQLHSLQSAQPALPVDSLTSYSVCWGRPSKVGFLPSFLTWLDLTYRHQCSSYRWIEFWPPSFQWLLHSCPRQLIVKTKNQDYRNTRWLTSIKADWQIQWYKTLKIHSTRVFQVKEFPREHSESHFGSDILTFTWQSYSRQPTSIRQPKQHLRQLYASKHNETKEFLQNQKYTKIQKKKRGKQ